MRIPDPRAPPVLLGGTGAFFMDVEVAMRTALQTGSRPEAMADVPGVCELPLTGAVVQYRDRHEVGAPGGRVRDIGLGLVLDGEYAATAEIVDLGSAEVKVLDLGAELVILDWVYRPTLAHVREILRAGAGGTPGGVGERREAGRYCFDLALRVVGRLGFTALTRPTILRIGFRDICRDLDLNDATAVRIAVDGLGVVRVHLDYDGNVLLLDTGRATADRGMEDLLLSAFPGRDVRRAGGRDRRIRYQVRFALPLSLAEARAELEAIRTGLCHLYAAYEPERYRTILDSLDAFGTRSTLARLRLQEPLEEPRPVPGHPWPGSSRVH